MKEIPHNSGDYLKKKAREHFAKAILCGVFLVFLLFISTPGMPTYILTPEYDNMVTVFLMVPAVAVYIHFKLYNDCKRGMKGEDKVKKLLNSEFGDDYYSINDLEYVYDDKGNKANIDHIFLAPNGIFVIETKDAKGKIAYKRDFWSLPFSFSPSKQVRLNGMWVKKTIDNSQLFGFGVWVEPIIVFTNDEVELTVIDPEVERVVTLEKLAESIKSFKKYTFSSTQLENIGAEIIKKSNQ